MSSGRSCWGSNAQGRGTSALGFGLVVTSAPAPSPCTWKRSSERDPPPRALSLGAPCPTDLSQPRSASDLGPSAGASPQSRVTWSQEPASLEAAALPRQRSKPLPASQPGTPVWLLVSVLVMPQVCAQRPEGARRPDCTRCHHGMGTGREVGRANGELAWALGPGLEPASSPRGSRFCSHSSSPQPQPTGVLLSLPGHPAHTSIPAEPVQWSAFSLQVPFPVCCWIDDTCQRPAWAGGPRATRSLQSPHSASKNPTETQKAREAALAQDPGPGVHGSGSWRLNPSFPRRAGEGRCPLFQPWHGLGA